MGKAIDMFRHNVLHPGQVAFSLDPADDFKRVIRSGQFYRSERQGDVPRSRIKGSLEFVPPMLAQLLKVAAGAGGGDNGSAY